MADPLTHRPRFLRGSGIAGLAADLHDFAPMSFPDTPLGRHCRGYMETYAQALADAVAACSQETLTPEAYEKLCKKTAHEMKHHVLQFFDETDLLDKEDAIRKGLDNSAFFEFLYQSKSGAVQALDEFRIQQEMQEAEPGYPAEEEEGATRVAPRPEGARSPLFLSIERYLQHREKLWVEYKQFNPAWKIEERDEVDHAAMAGIWDVLSIHAQNFFPLPSNLQAYYQDAPPPPEHSHKLLGASGIRELRKHLPEGMLVFPSTSFGHANNDLVERYCHFIDEKLGKIQKNTEGRTWLSGRGFYEILQAARRDCLRGWKQFDAVDDADLPEAVSNFARSINTLGFTYYLADNYPAIAHAYPDGQVGVDTARYCKYREMIQAEYQDIYYGYDVSPELQHFDEALITMNLNIAQSQAVEAFFKPTLFKPRSWERY